jgi:N-acetyl sugar amidotransferase
MSRQYQVCNQCVMDTTDPEISFDEEGVCNHCKGFFLRVAEELRSKDPDQLQELIADIKSSGEGKQYDCIVGVSGGVDSTYVCFLANRYGLRPLAVHLDNGWNSELAVRNIELTLEKLSIELFTHVTDWEEFRDVQLSLWKSGVPNIEAVTDHCINTLLIKVASKFGVKHVLSGNNIATEGILPRSWGYDNRDWKFIKSIQKQFGTMSTASLPHMNLANAVYYLIFKKIKFVRLLDYIDFSKEDACQQLEAELGWKPYVFKHGESIFTRFFQGVILVDRFGIDKRKAHYSSLICSGQMTRNDAMSLLEQPPYEGQQREADLEFVLKKFQLTREEFVSFQNAPRRDHNSFPSNSWIFESELIKRLTKILAIKT